MSDKRSRRRFLADMLFIGGGLTAASVLVKSQLFPGAPPGPTVAGQMVAPGVDPSCSPIPAGDMEPPGVAPGAVEQPDPDCLSQPPAGEEPRQPVRDPMQEPSRVPPRIVEAPNPAGGRRPPPPPAPGGL